MIAAFFLSTGFGFYVAMLIVILEITK